MARPAVEVEGARQLRRTMRKAGLDLQQLKDAHAAASRIVAAAATSRAPIRTGRLQSTIRAAGTTTAGIVRAGYKSVPYAGPIHWGWPARSITADPFLVDAAADTESSWIGAYERNIAAIINTIEGAPR